MSDPDAKKRCQANGGTFNARDGNKIYTCTNCPASPGCEFNGYCDKFCSPLQTGTTTGATTGATTDTTSGATTVATTGATTDTTTDSDGATDDR